MSQSFLFPFFFGVSTSHILFNQSHSLCQLIIFPSNKQLMFILLMNFHWIQISLNSTINPSLSHLSSPYQANGFSLSQNIQLFPFGFKTHWFNFLYIDFECFLSTPKVTKLQLELESPFEINFSFSSLELLYFSTAIFMVCTGFSFLRL